MKDWQREGSCPKLDAQGSAHIKYEVTAVGIIVSADVNGVPARLLVDTGATVTTITADLAARAKAKMSDQGRSVVTTVNGQIELDAGRVGYLAVSGAKLNDAPVFVHRERAPFGAGVDGLLGMSFLGNYKTRIDNGTLALEPNN
jgi:aspartyl protease family protein